VTTFDTLLEIFLLGVSFYCSIETDGGGFKHSAFLTMKVMQFIIHGVTGKVVDEYCKKLGGAGMIGNIPVHSKYSFLVIKGIIQRDGSGRNKVHSKGLY
jgi:hypothetical protein